MLVLADAHLKVFQPLQDVAPSVAVQLEDVQPVRVPVEAGRALQQHRVYLGKVVGARVVELEADDSERLEGG